MDFLKIVGILEIPKNEENTNFTKVKFDSPDSDNDEWVIMMPSRNDMFQGMTNPPKIEEAQVLLNDYISNKNLLIKTIQKWLADNSNIKLNLRMAEPNQGFLVKDN